MKKFKCYKCGTISAVDDAATQATCPKCGTVCRFAPVSKPAAQSAPQPAPQPVPQPVPQPAPVAAPVAAEQPMAPQPAPVAAPAGAASARYVQEQAERTAILTLFAPYIMQKDYDKLMQAVMTAPIEALRRAVSIKLKNPLVTLLLSHMFFFTGIDRLYAGYIALGICKWIFGACTFFIWNFVDVFICYRSAKKKNINLILEACGMPPVQK